MQISVLLYEDEWGVPSREPVNEKKTTIIFPNTTDTTVWISVDTSSDGFGANYLLKSNPIHTLQSPTINMYGLE